MCTPLVPMHLALGAAERALCAAIWNIIEASLAKATQLTHTHTNYIEQPMHTNSMAKLYTFARTHTHTEHDYCGELVLASSRESPIEFDGAGPNERKERRANSTRTVCFELAHSTDDDELVQIANEIASKNDKMSCREAEFGSILVDLTGTAEQECDLNQEFIENQSLVGGECDVIFSKQQQISDLNDLNDVQMIAPAATEKVVSATTKTTLLDENPDLDCELAAQSLNNKIDLELDITSDTEEPMSSLNTVVDLHEQSSECAGQCELRDLDSTQLKQQPQSAEHGRAHSDFCLQSLSIEESSSNAICVANKNTITAESTTTTTTPEILFASADSISRFKDTQNGNVVPASQLDLLATSLLNDELGDLATNEGLNGNKLNGNNNNDDDVQRNFQGCSREANSGSTNGK